MKKKLKKSQIICQLVGIFSLLHMDVDFVNIKHTNKFEIAG